MISASLAAWKSALTVYFCLYFFISNEWQHRYYADAREKFLWQIFTTGVFFVVKEPKQTSLRAIY
jgi:hypothetical protein